MTDNIPVLVFRWKQVSNVVRHGDQVEAVALGHFYQCLHTGKASPVIFEKVRELIPEKDNSIKIVIPNDGSDPILQNFFCQCQHTNTALVSHFHDFGHKLGKRQPVKGLQFIY